MDHVSPPSTGTLKFIWNVRHLPKVWGIAGEERLEYGRLLQQLLAIRSEFLALGERNPQAMAFRFPFYRELWEHEHKPLVEAVLNHLKDTFNTLKRFEWSDSEIKKFHYLIFDDNMPFGFVMMSQTIKGEALLEALYMHERLLRGLQTKGRLYDFERRLGLAVKRATGINPL